MKTFKTTQQQISLKPIGRDKHVTSHSNSCGRLLDAVFWIGRCVKVFIESFQQNVQYTFQFISHSLFQIEILQSWKWVFNLQPNREGMYIPHWHLKYWKVTWFIVNFIIYSNVLFCYLMYYRFMLMFPHSIIWTTLI